MLRISSPDCIITFTCKDRNGHCKDDTFNTLWRLMFMVIPSGAFLGYCKVSPKSLKTWI